MFFLTIVSPLQHPLSESASAGKGSLEGLQAIPTTVVVSQTTHENRYNENKGPSATATRPGGGIEQQRVDGHVSTADVQRHDAGNRS